MKYMTESAQGVMSELKLGAMAEQRAHDPELKQFAGKELGTVSGHKKAVDALQARLK